MRGTVILWAVAVPVPGASVGEVTTQFLGAKPEEGGIMMKFRVRNTGGFQTQEALSYLAENGCQVSYGKWEGLPDAEEAICREIKGIDATIAGGEPYTEKVFDAADRLKIVARTGTGFDGIDLEAATEHGVWVTNTPGGVSRAVADFTIGLILSLLRNIPWMAQDMKRGRWQPFRGRELGSLTLGIVGTGSIGREVIKRASSFGPKVLAYDVRPDEGFAAEWGVAYVPLDDLMAQSDVVSLHCSLNESTRGLIDERRLMLMKSTAYLVNTSRAAVVDRAALLEVLRAGEIAAAALDVHDPAPCAPNNPLVLEDNVLATPWSAFSTQESVAHMSITAVREVVAVLQGRAPTHPLNDLPSSGEA